MTDFISAIASVAHDLKQEGKEHVARAALSSMIDSGTARKKRVAKGKQNSCLTTRAFKRGAAESGKNVRSSEGLGEGASRIPCPPPVAIGPCSRLPTSEPFVAPYVAGLDKLMVSFWLDGEGFDAFRAQLKEFKAEFDDEDLCGPEVGERAFDLGWEGMSFNMSRTGAGKSPYKLSCGDIVLLFSNHKAKAPHPNCRIEIHSMSCWNPGWKAVMQRFFELLSHIGATIRKQTITEHHITVDLLDVDYKKTGLINHRRWLTKAPKKISPTFEYYQPNYISFGKGNFMLRCYDKPADLKNDPVKKAFFYQLWFDRFGYVPEHVTRIEFQIRRAVSRELEVNTIEDLEEKLDAIWQYCVTDWCRFCSKKLSAKDRKNKHQARYSTAFLWDFVRSVRFGGAEQAVEPIVRKRLEPQRDPEHLKKMAASYLLTVCAIEGMHPHDIDSHLTNSFNIITQQLEKKYQENPKEYVRKVETVRNASINTLFNEFYETDPYAKDCFAKHDYPRSYYRTKSNTYTKMYGATA